MKKTSTKSIIFSVVTLTFLALITPFAIHYGLRVSTNYDMGQFLPKNHPLLAWDQESKKVFRISEAAPHILLLSLKNSKARWHQKYYLDGLTTLTNEIEKLDSVKSVISLGNIRSAYEQKNQLLVGTLRELQREGFKVQNILKDPLYTPNLVSKDGRHAAVFVLPHVMEQEKHAALMAELEFLAKKHVSGAKVQLGGPAAIRTQLIDLLSRELLIFVLLSLSGAMAVIKFTFHGWNVIPKILGILTIANILALGIAGYFGFQINILSSTMPIIVTVTALGITNHTLVRMAVGSHLPYRKRMEFMRKLMLELLLPHGLTLATTAAGYACLMISDVQLIAEFGKMVALGVLASGFTALLLVPNILLWTEWPKPREYVLKAEGFAYFLVRKAKYIVPGVAAFVVLMAIIGTNIRWTAKIFDDLPPGHSARETTEFISKKLGGVASLDFMIGGSKLNEPWKDPANLKKLHQFAKRWRKNKDVGSILTLSDFFTTGTNKQKLPKKRTAIAEMQFLYSMSGDSPLEQFLSSDGKWTRVAIRLPDLPADKNNAVVAQMTKDLQAAFPKMEVRASGIAALLPTVNMQVSRGLMWGFFEALFWMVILLMIALRSLKWALVAVIPNTIPPLVLLGLMALFGVDIKPGIAIIFAISLGMSFDNTVYILLRLSYVLKSSPHTRILPVYSLMRRETMPCLVSTTALMAGFSIFLFSQFPINKMFGVFMLLALLASLLGDLVWLPTLLRRYPWLLLEKGEGYMFFENLSTPVRRLARMSPYIIFVALGLFAFRNTYAASKMDVKEILKAVEKRSAPPSERVEMKMVIRDADGTKKERELTILRKNEGEPRALIRLQKPSDLKGLSLLTISSGEKEDQWLYLPSDKKSRRILGSNKKGKFLDSEIAYEDLSLSMYKEFNNRIIKDDGKIIQIESKAKPDSESSYGKIITWVTKADSRVERVDYYDQKGKILKRATFSNYQKVGDKFWRAKKLSVVNLQDKRRTDLILKNVSLKKISDAEISLAALED